MSESVGAGRSGNGRALVAYESHFGCTRAVAEAVAAGLGAHWQAVVVDVGHGRRPEPSGDEDLLIVGGPTHAWGMSRPRTRRIAEEAARATQGEPEAAGIGIREWIGDLGRRTTAAAAFDTRLDGPSLLTGRASRHIGHLLQAHGCNLVVPPVSFLVDRHNVLLPGEIERAQAWGAELAELRLSQIRH